MFDSILMHILEYSPAQADILDFLNDRIRDFQSADVDARYILAGPAAYERLRAAMAERFGRSPGTFETYQYIPDCRRPGPLGHAVRPSRPLRMRERSETLQSGRIDSRAKGAKLYKVDELTLQNE